MNPTAPTTSVLDQAAAHLAAAAKLLEVQDLSEQIFSPARGLAAQLVLIGAGISPGIGAPTGNFAPLTTVVAHVDYALNLLDSVAAGNTPADLLVWSLRLHELRPRVLTVTAHA